MFDTSTNTTAGRLLIDSIGYFGGLAVSEDGSRVYVSNTAGFAYAFDIQGNCALAGTCALTIVTLGGIPAGVAFSPDGSRAYIANVSFESNSVWVVDTATATVIATAQTGQSPFAVAVTPDGTRLYVVNALDGLSSSVSVC